MSLLDKIMEVKEKNEGKICIFRQGVFYVVIGDDACILTERVGLKKICYCKGVCKVGIPINTINRYMQVFKRLKLNFCVFDYTEKLGEYEFMYSEKIYIKTYEYTKGKKKKKLDKYIIDCNECILNQPKRNLIDRLLN